MILVNTSTDLALSATTCTPPTKQVILSADTKVVYTSNDFGTKLHSLMLARTIYCILKNKALYIQCHVIPLEAQTVFDEADPHREWK